MALRERDKKGLLSNCAPQELCDNIVRPYDDEIKERESITVKDMGLPPWGNQVTKVRVHDNGNVRSTM